MKRLGILTAGGDTPALNATIHGAVTRANRLKVEIVGHRGSIEKAALIKAITGLLK